MLTFLLNGRARTLDLPLLPFTSLYFSLPESWPPSIPPSRHGHPPQRAAAPWGRNVTSAPERSPGVPHPEPPLARTCAGGACLGQDLPVYGESGGRNVLKSPVSLRDVLL